MAFLKAALILLLLHPAILKRTEKPLNRKLPPLRSILLQIIGRCVRRANRAHIKTLPITVPLLLPHLTELNLLNLIIEDLCLDLTERFKKFKFPDKPQLFYNDPLSANLLIVLDYLYLVNESFHAMSYTGRIEQTKFYYNFPSYFDVCEDYAHWRDLAGDISERHLPFAFCDYPWIFDLDAKRTLLTASNGLKQRHHHQDSFFRAIFDGVQSTCLHLCVRRGQHLLQDARDQLRRVPFHQLAKQLRVTFQGEEGIDEGGLRKEFFQLCWDEIFNENTGGPFICLSHETSTFWFNCSSNDLEMCTFVGVLLALAIYNGVLVAPRFPSLLFKKLLNWPLQLDDYSEIDPILVRSINQLITDGDDLIELYHVVPGTSDLELIPNGTNIPVTPENLINYIKLLSDYFLFKSTRDVFDAFRDGFETISTGSVIYGYRPDELFALAYGSDQFDISDLRTIACYEGGYTEYSPQITWLWDILVNEFNKREQANFLAFVTGSSRAPLGGLTRLKSFTVTRNTDESIRLPSAHTCYNILLLPEYDSRDRLMGKLRLSIEHNQGFGLV